MKKFVTLLLLISMELFSQDTIRFRNGDVQAVKVNEVGVTEIKYNRFDNVNGPQYVVDKNDIRLIKYSGGLIDSFAVQKKEVVANVEESKFKSFKATSICEGLVIRGNKIFCNNKAVGESKLLKIIKASPESEKRNMMMQSYLQMKTYKKKQYLFGFVGLGVGVAGAYMGALSALIAISGETVPAPLLGIVVVGASVGIAGGVISSKYKRKRTIQKLETAKIYNN